MLKLNFIIKNYFFFQISWTFFKVFNFFQIRSIYCFKFFQLKSSMCFITSNVSERNSQIIPKINRTFFFIFLSFRKMQYSCAFAWYFSLNLQFLVWFAQIFFAMFLIYFSFFPSIYLLTQHIFSTVMWDVGLVFRMNIAKASQKLMTIWWMSHESFYLA